MKGIYPFLHVDRQCTKMYITKNQLDRVKPVALKLHHLSVLRSIRLRSPPKPCMLFLEPDFPLLQDSPFIMPVKGDMGGEEVSCFQWEFWTLETAWIYANSLRVCADVQIQHSPSIVLIMAQ